MKTSITHLVNKAKFYNIGKRHNEKLEAFLEQFKATQDKAKCQNKLDKDLAVHYLSVLGDNAFTQIIIDISDGIRDNWWTLG